MIRIVVVLLIVVFTIFFIKTDPENFLIGYVFNIIPLVLFIIVFALYKYFGIMMRKKRNNAVRKELLSKFNAPITAEYNYAHCKYILVSEPASLLSIDGSILNFTQIIGLEVEDNSKSISNTEKKPPTLGISNIFYSEGARIERAIYAPSKTETATIHDFTLILRFDSLTNPILRIHIGNNLELKSQLCNFFSIIVYRNKRLTN